MGTTAENATNALNRPAMAPPRGLVSNFDSPYSRGYLITVVGSFLVSLMTMFVRIRIYAKARIQRKLWWDDLTCGLAALTAIVYFVGCILCVKAGTGIHLWNRKAESMGYNFMLTSYLVAVLAAPALGLAKITFFFMYYQLFRPKITLRYLIYIGGLATVVFYTGSTIVQFIFMTPQRGETFVSHYQTPLQRKIFHFSVPHSAVGAGIDLYILVLPIAAVLQLKLATKRKVGIVLIFMAGSLAVMASFLSMYYRILLNKTSDLTWNLLPVILLCLAEACIVIICSCMPSVSSTLRHHAFHFATLQALFSFRVKYFSKSRSPSAPPPEPGFLAPYQRKVQMEYSEIEMGTSGSGGGEARSLEGLQQYDVESWGTKKSRTFVGEENRIHMIQEVTVSRQ